MKRMDHPQLVSLRDFSEAHKKLINLVQLRNIIRSADKNDAHMFLRRIGRRIFIDENKFFEWTKRRVK